jgi:thiamine-phosphate diphosphorylase
LADPPILRPRVVLVTDRRRLAEALHRPESQWQPMLTDQIRGAIDGGVDLIQVRERDLTGRAILQFLYSLFQDVPQSADKVVLNDRLDVALAAGARGVHLRERSLPAASARRLAHAPGFVIGRSVHDPEGARLNHGASYLMAGTVKASMSKPEPVEPLGWDGLRRVVEAARNVPVIAIGGMTVSDVGDAVSRGASGLAAIGWFIPADREPLASFVQQRVVEMRLAFDSENHVT